jgi:hypothetical protein
VRRDASRDIVKMIKENKGGTKLEEQPNRLNRPVKA